MTTFGKNSDSDSISNTISDENDFENNKLIKSKKLYKNDISKNYLLDHLNLDKEIEFYYDGAKFSLKVDKVLDKNAVIIERETAYLFSTYTITCDKKDFAKFDSFITTSIKFYSHFYDDDIKQEANKIKLFMTKNPFVVEENTLASEILLQMNRRKITNVCVFKKGNTKRTTGVIHIHNLLNNLK